VTEAYCLISLYVLSYTGLKLGVSAQEKTTDSGCLETGRCGEYFDQREKIKEETGEICLKSRFVICIFAYYEGDEIKKMRLEGHVALTKEIVSTYKILLTKRERRDRLADL